MNADPSLSASLASDTGTPAAALPPTPTAQRLRILAVGTLLLLALLCLAWELFLAPLRPGGSWWAIKAIPLFLPLLGLLRHRMYTYRWVSLMIWLYFTEGVVRATSESGDGAALAWGETVLSLVLFTVCTIYIRHRLKAGRPQQSEVA